MFWHIHWVWHGGIISKAAVGDWRESSLWVCRKCIDGRGRDYARFGNTSDMAFAADIDGGGLGAYLRIGDFGGGEVGGSDTPRMMANDMSWTPAHHWLAFHEMPI